jgi:hypothetical protein
MRLFRIEVLLFVCLTISLCAKGQSSSPDETVTAFRSVSEIEMARLSRRFDIKDDWRGFVCQDLNPPKLIHLLSEVGKRVSVVELTAPGCQMSFLLVYWQEKEKWIYGGTIALNESYGKHPHFDAMKLIYDQRPVIVVDDNQVASGTGLSQENTQIYMLIDGKMRIVFDQPRQSFLQVPPSRSETKPYIQKQDSTFKFSPSVQAGRRENLIEETRVSVVNDQAVTEHFAYGWDPRLMTLTMQPYSPY